MLVLLQVGRNLSKTVTFAENPAESRLPHTDTRGWAGSPDECFKVRKSTSLLTGHPFCPLPYIILDLSLWLLSCHLQERTWTTYRWLLLLSQVWTSHFKLQTEIYKTSFCGNNLLLLELLTKVFKNNW